MKYDFGGYVTKANTKCADNRVISPNAFEHQDGHRIPLVYQHNRQSLDNVLGFVDLENRQDGVYGYGQFNDTEQGQVSKKLVEHGDIGCLSIFANDLRQTGNVVEHGKIIEVSLVLAGANPGAVIDNLMIEHSDGSYTTEDGAAIICSGDNLNTDGDDLEHADPVVKKKEDTKKTDDPKPKDDEKEEDDDEMADDRTIQDIYNSMTDEQKDVVKFLVGAALSEAKGDDDDEDEKTDAKADKVKHSDDDDDEDSSLEHGYNESEDDIVKNNVFDNKNNTQGDTLQHALSAEEVANIFQDAQHLGSLKKSFLQHAATYGIENIDILFPDAKAVSNDPAFLKRDTEWVADVLAETNHVPFARVKSVVADITADEARARGYVTGAKKKEEVISLLKRQTVPTTVYKKQKLDRDDLLDIGDMGTVVWLKGEMRVMLNEELARAYLIGDGRDPESEDKINEQCIRPIWKDDDMYAHHVTVDANYDTAAFSEAVIRARKMYKGSGNPTLYTTSDLLTDMLLSTDKIGRRLYNTEAELASALRVKKIVEVPVMENLTRTVGGKTHSLLGIIVNLKDYTVGTNRGGEVNMFDDFDIDYNQYKYLLETRCSGALTMPKSALVLEAVASAPEEEEEEVG